MFNFPKITEVECLPLKACKGKNEIKAMRR